MAEPGSQWVARIRQYEEALTEARAALARVEAERDEARAIGLIAAEARCRQLEDTAQRVMQVLGPDVPDVDYTQPGNLAGLIEDVEEALRVLRAAGIQHQSRVSTDTPVQEPPKR